MATTTPSWEPALAAMEDAVTTLEERMDALAQRSPAELREKLSPLDQCKLDLLLAYNANSLFWMFLSSRGVDPAKHPVRAELGRVRDYMMKIKGLERDPSAARSNLNKEAAERFVRHALDDGNDQANDGSPSTKKSRTATNATTPDSDRKKAKKDKKDKREKKDKRDKRKSK